MARTLAVLVELVGGPFDGSVFNTMHASEHFIYPSSLYESKRNVVHIYVFEAASKTERGALRYTYCGHGFQEER